MENELRFRSIEGAIQNLQEGEEVQNKRLTKHGDEIDKLALSHNDLAQSVLLLRSSVNTVKDDTTDIKKALIDLVNAESPETRRIREEERERKRRVEQLKYDLFKWFAIAAVVLLLSTLFPHLNFK